MYGSTASSREGVIAVPDVMRHLPGAAGLSPVNMEALSGILDWRDVASRPNDGRVCHELERTVACELDGRRRECELESASRKEVPKVIQDSFVAVNGGMVRRHQQAIRRPNRQTSIGVRRIHGSEQFRRGSHDGRTIDIRIRRVHMSLC